MSIHAILKADHLALLAFGQEVELELEVALCAVGDATDEPLVAFALCCDAILTSFGFEDTSLVPVDWHTCKEIAAVGPLVVTARIVHQHLQIALGKYEDSQVEDLCAHTRADGTIAMMALGLIVKH